jgi:hypothetical protein
MTGTGRDKTGTCPGFDSLVKVGALCQANDGECTG